MKIYIASSFDEAKSCEMIRKLLTASGHEIPDVWWNVKTKDDFTDHSDAEFYSAPIVQAIAARHWRTIRECDAVVIVSNLETARSFTGANVEIGFAHALGKPILAVGLLKRSAMYVPVIQCGVSARQLIEAVDCIGQNQR